MFVALIVGLRRPTFLGGAISSVQNRLWTS